MPSKLYQEIETAVSFSSAGDVVFSAASVAFGAGRKSAQWDTGVTPQARRYAWRCKTKFQATPVVGETIDFYMATSDGTIIDGGVTAGDAAFTDEDALGNLLYIGSVKVDTTGTDTVQTSKTFTMHSRYGVLVMWNATAAETLSATNGDHDFIITPIPMETQ